MSQMSMMRLLAGGQAAPFTPTDVAGLIGWWDADDAATFTYSSGSVVSQWNDKSTNAYHFVQATVASQPGRTGTINGKSSVVFDGSNDYMTSSTAANWVSLSNSSSYTLCAVFKLANSGTYQSIMGTTNTASGGTGGPGFDVLGVIANRDLRHSVSAAADGNVVLNVSGTNVYSFATAFVYSVVSDTANGTASSRSALRIDGGTAIQNNAATATPSALNPQSALHIGRRGATDGVWLTGDIAEVLIYNSALGTTNRQSVESYLKSKWGTP